MFGVDGWNSGMAEPAPHPVTIALAAAVTDPAATDRALTVLDALPGAATPSAVGELGVC